MRRPTLSPQVYRLITLVALFALGVIVVTGAGVRLTGSGLGCPTWPNCEPGQLTPKTESGVHGDIEWANRLFTGVVSVSVMLAVLGSLVRVPRRRDLTWWSLSLVAGVLGQIVLGGLTVLFHLAPPFVMAHYLLSAVLVACATVLHHRAGEADRGQRRAVATPEIRTMTKVLLGLAAAVLFTGTVVTGSGPHGGDEEVERLGFALTDVSRIHSIVVWLLIGATVWTYFLVRRGGASPVVESGLRALIALEFSQGFIGYLQYFTGVPEGLVAIHVLGSMLVWIAALVVFLRTSTVEADPVPAAPAPAEASRT